MIRVICVICVIRVMPVGPGPRIGVRGRLCAGMTVWWVWILFAEE